MEDIVNVKDAQRVFIVNRMKINWRSSPVDGDQYTFLFPDNIKGDAQLIYQPLSDWTLGYGGKGFYHALSTQGMSDDAVIAHLNEFYPNGRGLNEGTNERMRTGRGSSALSYLWDESIKRKARIMYVFSGAQSMQAFLMKKDFIRFDKLRFYKIIEL